MKRLLFVTISIMLILSACASQRQKLGPHARVDLMTANEAYARQNVEEAQQYYELVLKDNPSYAHALRRLADINLYNGERFADRAVELNKAAFEGYDKAIKVTEGFAKKKDSDLADLRDMKKRKISAWTRIFKEGEKQMDDGNTKEAMKIFETVSLMDTTRVEPLIKLKTIYQKDLNDSAKAEQIMKKIYARNPNDVLLLQEMGIFYLNQKDYATAKPYFERVKGMEPLNVNNLMNLGFCQFELGQYADAKITNQLVLSIEPNNVDALTDAKYIAYKLNDNAAALGYLKQLLALRDDDKDYQEISFLLNEMKNYTELITYATKWYRYDETNKDAVRLVILGAQMTKNKPLETQFSDILKGMN